MGGGRGENRAPPLPAAAFAIANQVGNAGMNVLAMILIAAGIGYTYIIVRH
jgi:hypothetical protein